MMLLTRLMGTAFSPGGSAGGLSILIFHRVLPVPDPLFPEEPDAKRFAEILSWIRSSFNVVPLGQAIKDLDGNALPPRAVAITFDDGYADNYLVAMPILKRFGMPATFFVASDFLDGGRMWNDTIIESVRAYAGTELDLTHIGLERHQTVDALSRRRVIDELIPQVKYLPAAERSQIVGAIADACRAALPDDLMMSSDQLRALHAEGGEIGGHTRSHPILARLGDEEAKSEILEGKLALEGIIGESITLFAYPNGKPGRDYASRHATMVRDAGYSAAVSTAAGMVRRQTDRFQLPRFTPWDRTGFRFGLRMVANMRKSGEIAE